MRFEVLSRKMKLPPPRCHLQNEWQSFVRTLKVGEYADLKVGDMVLARKLLLRGAKVAGFRLTTRKSDHQTLEVYRTA
jgi:hypothetical protein